MTNEELREKWPVLKGRIQKEYPGFTSEELTYEIGKEELLLLSLQKKMNKNREQVDYWLSLLG